MLGLRPRSSEVSFRLGEMFFQISSGFELCLVGFAQKLAAGMQPGCQIRRFGVFRRQFGLQGFNLFLLLLRPGGQFHNPGVECPPLLFQLVNHRQLILDAETDLEKNIGQRLLRHMPLLFRQILGKPRGLFRPAGKIAARGPQERRDLASLFQRSHHRPEEFSRFDAVQPGVEIA